MYLFASRVHGPSVSDPKIKSTVYRVIGVRIIIYMVGE
jgi:hypothetical protein